MLKMHKRNERNVKQLENSQPGKSKKARCLEKKKYPYSVKNNIPKRIKKSPEVK